MRTMYMYMWRTNAYRTEIIYFYYIWHTLKLFERLKCEFEGEKKNGIKNWDTLPNSQHFGGKKGVLEFQDED
jgi:hypothetical protein